MLISHHAFKLEPKSLLRRSRHRSRFLAIATIESIYSSGGVNQLLLAGEKWVTGGANLDVQIIFPRRAGLKSFATCAANGYFFIFGVDSWFHLL